MSYNLLCTPWAELSAQEVYDMIQLRVAVFAVEQNCVYQDLDDFDQRAIHFLAYDGEKLIGYLRVFEAIDYYDNHASIGRVCSHPDYRNQSIGRVLMEQALAYIDQEYSKETTISAQHYLEQFYQSFGFLTVGEVYLEDGIDHVRMYRNTPSEDVNS